jgi:hypothetical protein
LIQGPDVWKVISAVRDVRSAVPKLAAHDVVAAVSNLTGVTSVHVRIAVDYYTAYPAEIDADLDANKAAEVALREQIARSQDLLGARNFLSTKCCLHGWKMDCAGEVSKHLPCSMTRVCQEHRIPTSSSTPPARAESS